MPLISSNPFDLVSEEESRQRCMYRHMLCVWSLGGAKLVHARYPRCDGSTNEDEPGDVATMERSDSEVTTSYQTLGTDALQSPRPEHMRSSQNS